jgi:hypothetical protein
MKREWKYGDVIYFKDNPDMMYMLTVQEAPEARISRPCPHWRSAAFSERSFSTEIRVNPDHLHAQLLKDDE